MKAGTSDALVLNSISRQAFDSDVKAGAASSGGPPGYQSVSFHVCLVPCQNGQNESFIQTG